MANYEYNTTTGIVVPDTSQIKSDVEQEFKNALGQDLDVSESTPQGRLIEAETVARKRTVENMALLANMFNKDQAFGIFLDSLASVFGVDRIGSTRTRVTCQLTGTANTVIPANAQAQDENGNLYYLENQVTLDSNGDATGYFLSINKGAIECPANSLNQIVTAVLGWSTVNNSSAGAVGLEGESDTELRKSLPKKQYQGKSLNEAIRSNVLRVEGVDSCLVIDNDTNSNDTTSVSGKTLPPHSLWVCVDGGNNNEIAQAIFDTKSIGCAYAGTDVSVNVSDGSQTYSVSFDRPTTQRIYVSITVDVSALGGSSNINEEAVKNAIISYANGEVAEVDGLKVGVNVNAFEIASAVTIQIPELFIVDVKVSSDNTNWVTNINIAKKQKATIDVDDITVTQQ